MGSAFRFVQTCNLQLSKKIGNGLSCTCLVICFSEIGIEYLKSVLCNFLCFLLYLRLILQSIIRDRKFGFTLKMRTFQFQMPTFLMETCLTLRFTFCDVSPKIVTNSVPMFSIIYLIEVLTTNKLKSIVGS